MNGEAGPPFPMVDPEPADPGGNLGHPIGPGAGRHRRPEPNNRATPRVTPAVEGSSSADGELQLDHRLQPVDVGTFEQTGLDQAHSPRRIPRGHVARLPL